MSYQNCRISSPFLFLNTLDSHEEIKTPINLIGYFQNLLYFDRGNRRLGPPPGGFRHPPTLNLLSQILCNLEQVCQDQSVEQTLEIKSSSLETLVSLLANGYATNSQVETNPNQFLSDLRFIVYPNSFYTKSDCSLNLVLQRGAEKFYGIARAFHTVGRAFLQPLIGSRISFDASNWVKLGSFAQFKCVMENVKVNGDCIAITNNEQLSRVFNRASLADRIYRDRLILYQAFLNWCLQNTWHEELLSFTYSDYHSDSNRYGSAITLQVASERGESSSSGTALCFLHSDDLFTPPKPPECPPVSIQNIEGNRGLYNNLYNNLGCAKDYDLNSISLMVPIEYWRFIVQLQTDKFPGAASHHYPEPCYQSGPYPEPCYQSKGGYEQQSCDGNSTVSSYAPLVVNNRSNGNYFGAMANAALTTDTINLTNHSGPGQQMRKPNFLGSNSSRSNKFLQNTSVDDDVSSEISVSVQTTTNESSGFSTLNF